MKAFGIHPTEWSQSHYPLEPMATMVKNPFVFGSISKRLKMIPDGEFGTGFAQQTHMRKNAR